MVDSNIIYNSYYSWWKNIDKFLLFLILSLFFLGLFFSLVSTSLIASDKLNTNSYYFFVKHLTITLLAFTILIIFSFFEKSRLLNICLNFIYNFFYFFSFGAFYWCRSQRFKKMDGSKYITSISAY